MGFGEGIKKLREDKGWTQGKLAMLSGVSRSQIAMLESGKRKQPSGDSIYRLAKAMQNTLADFYRACGYDVGNEIDVGLVEAIKESIKQHYNPELAKRLK